MPVYSSAGRFLTDVQGVRARHMGEPQGHGSFDLLYHYPIGQSALYTYVYHVCGVIVSS